MAERKARALTDYRPVRIALVHERLLISAAVGLAAFFLLPVEWALSTRLLVTWDVAVALYLILVAVMMARADQDYICRRAAAAQDEGTSFILVLIAVVVVASLGAIFAELGGAAKAHPENHAWHTSLAVATITLSWLFTHTIFALHYAYEYYGVLGDGGSGLEFPNEKEPDYWDFMYFSLVIGMTSQVSDVPVSDRTIRRMVAAHGVFSFLFNATLIALTVNIAAGVI
jgi:uncharacterized membrane protein